MNTHGLEEKATTSEYSQNKAKNIKISKNQKGTTGYTIRNGKQT